MKESYGYNTADQLLSSSDPSATTAQYDSHGNMTSLGLTTPVAFGYDSSDRNTSISQGGTSTAYVRDAQDRITQHTVTAPATSAVPTPWTSVDIGSPTVAGSASYATGTYTVTGAGQDMWDDSGTVYDQFHFVYQPMTGNGTVITRVTSQTYPSDYARAGLIIKASTTSGSNYAAVFTNPSGLVRQDVNFTNDTAGAGFSYPE